MSGESNGRESFNIYYGAAIGGATREQSEISRRRIQVLQQYGHVFNEHIGNPDVRAIEQANVAAGVNITDRDLERLNDSDLMIADHLAPSTGLGFEIAYMAITRHTPVVSLMPHGKGSNMIRGFTHPMHKIIDYTSEQELELKVDTFMKEYRQPEKLYPRYIVYDSIDGVGKDTMSEEFKKWANENKLWIFDATEYMKRHRTSPQWADIIQSEPQQPGAVFLSEPSYGDVGCLIRNQLITKEGLKQFGTRTTMGGYSLDRDLLLPQLITPALEAGAYVFSSRSVSTSEVYQPEQGVDEGYSAEVLLGEVRGLPGNQRALRHRPGLLIIPMIDVSVAQKRMEHRAKDGFEANVGFQERAAAKFMGDRIWRTYERRGTKIKRLFFDADAPREKNKKLARDTLENYLNNR